MSANVADRATIKIERVFDAPRELVFEAWTRPEYLLRWFAPHGCTISFTQIDVRPGGRLHCCVHNPLGDCWCVGVYREIVRPERIVYSLATADSAGNVIDPVLAGHDPRWPRETLVTVTLAELRGGSTRLTLEQSVLESLARHTGAYPSWLQMLDRLEALMSTRQAGVA
jgi:uncharacterized protein YndB with AHSA1/START domain